MVRLRCAGGDHGNLGKWQHSSVDGNGRLICEVLLGSEARRYWRGPWLGLPGLGLHLAPCSRTVTGAPPIEASSSMLAAVPLLTAAAAPSGLPPVVRLLRACGIRVSS